VKVDKQYVFDGPQGTVTLAELFDGRSQLFVKHFMMGPGQISQCVGCSLEVDQIEARSCTSEPRRLLRRGGARADQGDRDRSQADGMALHVGIVRTTPISTTTSTSRSRPTTSAGRAFYNYEHVTAPLEDLSGDQRLRHANMPGRSSTLYSTYGRGGEEFPRHLPVSRRDAERPWRARAHTTRCGPGTPKNMYGKGGLVEGNGRYHQPECGLHRSPGGRSLSPHPGGA
jgi:hypothetical protein